MRLGRLQQMISKNQIKEGTIVRYNTELVDYYGIVFQIDERINGRCFVSIRWINHKFYSIDDENVCEMFNNEYTKFWSVV
jgi:hypothetical protein